jgi:hypothetical protein
MLKVVLHLVVAIKRREEKRRKPSYKDKAHKALKRLRKEIRGLTLS